MAIRIEFAAQFAEAAGGHTHLEAEGRTVGEVLRHATDRYPALRGLIWSRLTEPYKELNPVVAVFVNGEPVHAAEPWVAPVRDGDSLLVLSAVEGG
jgi:molybdopterin converting factor small subunit